MGIINVVANGVPGQQSEWSAQARTELNGSFMNIKARIEANVKRQWTDDSGSGGLTIQQKFDAFGTDAGSLMSFATAVITMIQTIDPSYVPVTPASLGHTFTKNADGTVTVNS